MKQITAAKSRDQAGPLTDAELQRLNAYWRAANYLPVGQIYLIDNPLLGEPLSLEHIKPRLLGHWGTTPGLNFIYVHLNRAITCSCRARSAGPTKHSFDQGGAACQLRSVSG